MKKGGANRSLIKKFLLCAKKAIIDGISPSNLKDSCGVYIGKNIQISLNSEFLNSLEEVIVESEKLHESRLFCKKSLRKNLFSLIDDLDLNNTTEQIALHRILSEISPEHEKIWQMVAPNFAFIFRDDVESIKIGPVLGILSSIITDKRNTEFPNASIQLGAGESYSFSLFHGKPRVILPKYCWVIEVNSTKENAESEARWLIDSAISFLRIKYRKWEPIFARPGEIEWNPTRAPQIERECVLLHEEITHFGIDAPKRYNINREVKELTESESFKMQTDSIFYPTSKASIGSRIRQGLGWLTRGRRSSDHSERILYFFTAIEALLTGADNSAPVVHNLSRTAAVILSDEIGQRYQIAEEIKNIYGSRSRTVHSGARSASSATAYQLQCIAERIFANVFDYCDLSENHSTFLQELTRSTHGFPWKTKRG